MEKRKLLIADGSEEFRTHLADVLSGQYRIHTCADGVQALEELKSFSPELMILDLMLPGLDGISMLYAAAEQNVMPVVLALTFYSNDYVVESINRLNVGYLMMKPCNIKAVSDRLADLACKIPQSGAEMPDKRTAVTNLLLAFGIPTKLRGYTYLREAILLMVNDPTQMVTKHLYPAVAEICGCDVTHVERCIRSAIYAAWERRDVHFWSLYFPKTADGLMLKPTNAAFISRLADSLMIRGEEPCYRKSV